MNLNLQVQSCLLVRTESIMASLVTVLDSAVSISLVLSWAAMSPYHQAGAAAARTGRNLAGGGGGEMSRGERSVHRQPRIIGGKKTTTEKYPYAVSLQGKGSDGNNRHFCGGSLVKIPAPNFSHISIFTHF